MSKIVTVKDLKDLLDKYDDNMYVDFGSEKHGFEIDYYTSNNNNLSLRSNVLSNKIDGGGIINV